MASKPPFAKSQIRLAFVRLRTKARHLVKFA